MLLCHMISGFTQNYGVITNPDPSVSTYTLFLSFRTSVVTRKDHVARIHCRRRRRGTGETDASPLLGLCTVLLSLDL